VEFLNGEREIMPAPPPPPRLDPPEAECGDFADVRGQPHAKRALEVAAAGGRVIAYYALAAGAVALASAPGPVRRNMPDPVPVMVLGRLAVDRVWQGRGLGQGLLPDAILRTLQATEVGGIWAILVHAISEDAKRFSERHGFMPSPVDPMTLMITVKTALSAYPFPASGAYELAENRRQCK